MSELNDKSVYLGGLAGFATPSRDALLSRSRMTRPPVPDFHRSNGRDGEILVRILYLKAVRMSSEQDPLLPHGRAAPEIHGSRAPSINNGYTSTERAIQEDDQQRQRAANYRRLLNWVVFFIIVVALLFFTDKYFLRRLPDDKRSQPSTVEERVDRILSATPLIGTYTHFSCSELF
jgi:hypothetical protein